MRGERERREVAALYSSAREGIVRYLISAGVIPGNAEEATQEAFLRLYSALRDGQEIGHPKLWLYKVARNAAINVVKRNGIQSPFSEALEAVMSSPELSAEDQLLEREWIEEFRDAMQNLSDPQRLCLELRAQGLRYREIAEVLEIQTSTAAEFVGRGIEELKKWNRCKL